MMGETVTVELKFVSPAYHGEVVARLTDDNAKLRAALANVIASIHIATQRGWTGDQISYVQSAADGAQSALPAPSSGKEGS